MAASPIGPSESVPTRLQYTIYDFPIMNVIAGYFLLRALPSELVLLHGEPQEPGQPIALLPSWRVFEEPDPRRRHRIQSRQPARDAA